MSFSSLLRPGGKYRCYYRHRHLKQTCRTSRAEHEAHDWLLAHIIHSQDTGSTTARVSQPLSSSDLPHPSLPVNRTVQSGQLHQCGTGYKPVSQLLISHENGKLCLEKSWLWKPGNEHKCWQMTKHSSGELLNRGVGHTTLMCNAEFWDAWAELKSQFRGWQKQNNCNLTELSMYFWNNRKDPSMCGHIPEAWFEWLIIKTTCNTN